MTSPVHRPSSALRPQWSSARSTDYSQYALMTLLNVGQKQAGILAKRQIASYGSNWLHYTVSPASRLFRRESWNKDGIKFRNPGVMENVQSNGGDQESLVFWNRGSANASEFCVEVADTVMLPGIILMVEIGVTSSLLALKARCNVEVVDRNEECIAAWTSEDIPFDEPGLKSIVKTCRDEIRNLSFTNELENAVRNATMVFVCVDTPSASEENAIGKGLDLRNIHEILQTVARVACSELIIVQRSTVPCGAGIASGEFLDRSNSKEFHIEVVSNPEFLVGGSAVQNMLHPDRIVIGSTQTSAGHAAADRVKRLYASWVPCDRIITTDMWSSELAKLASNAMLAQKVSSINTLSILSEEIGGDIVKIARVIGSDRRIGESMLQAGPGFGGSCFRKDTMCLVYLAESLGQRMVADYWRNVIKLNELRMNRLSDRVIRTLGNSVAEKKITVLGLSFKDGVKDTRESPSFAIIKTLSLAGARLTVFDPGLTATQIETALFHAELTEDLRKGISVCSDIWTACDGACAALILADPRSFTSHLNQQSRRNQAEEGGNRKALLSSLDSFDWQTLFLNMTDPRYILDCRNYTDLHKLKELGFVVEGIGKRSLQIRGGIDNQRL